MVLLMALLHLLLQTWFCVFKPSLWFPFGCKSCKSCERLSKFKIREASLRRWVGWWRYQSVYSTKREETQSLLELYHHQGMTDSEFDVVRVQCLIRALCEGGEVSQITSLWASQEEFETRDWSRTRCVSPIDIWLLYDWELRFYVGDSSHHDCLEPSPNYLHLPRGYKRVV